LAVPPLAKRDADAAAGDHLGKGNTMASISSGPNGHRILQFVGVEGERHSIRLGKMTLRTAEIIKSKVEELLVAKVTGTSMSRELADWVTSIADCLHQKLVTKGLVEAKTPVQPAAPVDAPLLPLLGEFIDKFLAMRQDLKRNTRITFIQTRKAMLQFFGLERRINQITAGDVDEWLAEMRKQEYAPATIATFIKRARQVFGHAARKQLLINNPFKEMKLPSQVNKAREEFIAQATIAKVIDQCPNAEWRLIVALARYGGLRTPSETLTLEWLHVDWDRARVTIHAPKQEHLPSGGVREIPLFPELRPYLEEAFELAQEGSRFVISRYRDGDTNLRTHFQRIIAKAGVKPWGRLFHNLRSSRQTELTERFPAHVVSYWMGNTPRVAAQHYLQVRDSDFQRAAESEAPKTPALQNRRTQTGEDSREQSQEVRKVAGNVQLFDN
jgi:integrase